MPTVSTILKEELCTRVEILEEDGARVVRKTYRNRPFLLWRTFMVRSRAAREYRNLAAMHAAGVACVRPMSWSETRIAGCVPACVLTTEYIADSPSLKEVMCGLRDRHARKRLVTSFGQLVRQMHEQGFSSNRLTPRDCLVIGDDDESRELRLCDQVMAVYHGSSIAGQRAAFVDLYDMALSQSRRELFSGTERLRMMLGYTNGDRHAARQLWRRLARRSRWFNRTVRGYRAFFSNYGGRTATTAEPLELRTATDT